jgi:hypothetical protein
MRAVAGSFVALVLLTAAAAAGDLADDPSSLARIDDAAYDAGFQCPETLADPDQREEDLARFMAWAKLRHPDWNLKKRLDVRYGLLRRHGCAATLANIASSTKPAFAP